MRGRPCDRCVQLPAGARRLRLAAVGPRHGRGGGDPQRRRGGPRPSAFGRGLLKRFGLPRPRTLHAADGRPGYVRSAAARSSRRRTSRWSAGCTRARIRDLRAGLARIRAVVLGAAEVLGTARRPTPFRCRTANASARSAGRARPAPRAPAPSCWTRCWSGSAWLASASSRRRVTSARPATGSRFRASPGPLRLPISPQSAARGWRWTPPTAVSTRSFGTTSPGPRPTRAGVWAAVVFRRLAAARLPARAAAPRNAPWVPDVSAHASMFPGWPVVIDENWVEDAGTSSSAPLVAGAVAAVSARERAAGRPPLGPGQRAPLCAAVHHARRSVRRRLGRQRLRPQSAGVQPAPGWPGEWPRRAAFRPAGRRAPRRCHYALKVPDWNYRTSDQELIEPRNALRCVD